MLIGGGDSGVDRYSHTLPMPAGVPFRFGPHGRARPEASRINEMACRFRFSLLALATAKEPGSGIGYFTAR